ncbi:MAG: RimK family alpha-L-glutamate ligase [Pirellulales bacterium]
MTIRMGILGSSTGPYVQDLVRACHEAGVDVLQLGFPDLQTQIGLHTNALPDGCLQVSTPLQILNDLDAVIVRTMPLGSVEQIIFRMDCLHALQAQCVQVVNSPRCLETSIDKWLTLQRLSEANLRVPPTIACQNRDSALAAFEQLGRDVLLKPLFGGEGRGIMRIQDADLAWRAFSTLSQLGHVLYLQQYIPNFGYDIRVLKIGNRLLSIRRTAQVGSFRTNVSLGGIAEPIILSDTQQELAIRAAKCVDGEIVGVDILPGKDGRDYLLEVNAVPGWRGVAASLKCDVARLIVDYIADRITASSR